MNKKQKKARLKYLKQIQRGPDPREIKKQKMLDLLLPKSQDQLPGKCRTCRYKLTAASKPRSPIQVMYCMKFDRYRKENEPFTRFTFNPGSKPGCHYYQPLN